LADAIALAEEERSTAMRTSGFHDSTRSYNTSLTTYRPIRRVLSHVAYNFAERIMIQLEMAAGYRDSSQSIHPILEGRNGWHRTTRHAHNVRQQETRTYAQRRHLRQRNVLRQRNTNTSSQTIHPIIEGRNNWHRTMRHAHNVRPQATRTYAQHNI
jgi:hypothetical protein